MELEAGGVQYEVETVGVCGLRALVLASRWRDQKDELSGAPG